MKKKKKTYMITIEIHGVDALVSPSTVFNYVTDKIDRLMRNDILNISNFDIYDEYNHRLIAHVTKCKNDCREEK